MNDKKFIKELLNGCFISKRSCRHKNYHHALYNKQGDIVGVVSDARMSKYGKVFKRNKSKITFNLNLVRQQHGNSLVKSLYKKSKQNLSHDNAQDINGTSLSKPRLQPVRHDERQQSFEFE